MLYLHSTVFIKCITEQTYAHIHMNSQTCVIFFVLQTQDILENAGKQIPLVTIDFYCMDLKPMQVNGDPRFSVTDIF